MPNDRDDRIRERAYAIWETQGRPDGQHEDHWSQAEAELPEDAADPLPPGATDIAGTAPDAPSAPARRKPTPGDRAPAE